MGGTFWECAKPRYSCRMMKKRGKWKNLWFLVCEESFVLWGKLATVLKGLKNIKAPGADSIANEFLKYGGSEVRNKLLKIMNIVFEKRKYVMILGKP